MIIAVSGKGGAGKTTLAALIVRYLIRKNERPILAVDADPNANFSDKLGIRTDITIGDLREDALKHKYNGPAGIPKQSLIEYGVQNAVAEGSDFDLIVMGRGEGPGCYCSVNNMLRTFLQRLSSKYKHVVIDNEAGMEHLSRRTNDKVDLMLIVSDPTPTCL
ncbi:MAG: AAA family ATPase, partial [Armatimonadota bacterium]|nr:AAA family ATPase [Armatimonadota bacterium]